ncbi:uncharacterized protein LOC112467316 isoform X2 [Temnothorax curvispinosus]|nr:uncharacterized protein LOC112467316 isoform X2 [Temnothorax curvispinosus]
MDTNSRRKNRKNTKASSKNQQREDIKSEDNDKIKEVLLWPTFDEDIRLCTGSRKYQHLIRLLLLYTEKVCSSVAKPSNVQDDLKNHIKKMLIFFHLYWLDIKQDKADHSRYLNEISVLLNVYIDMELKPYMEERTSSHIKEFSKIATKILAALYIYLNNSEEHIFKVLLKIKQMTEKHNEVWNNIFKERFTKLKTKMTSITDNSKSLDQTCLQPGKSEKTEVIDLTGDDEITTPCKVKRKKTKQKSKWSRVTKNKPRSKKHLSKYSTKLVNADVKECSNKDNCHINPKKDVTKNQMSNICPEFAKEDEKQHDLDCSKSQMFVDQNIKENIKVTKESKLLKESKLENCVSSYMTIGNATSCTQNKGALISQEESAMETIPLFNTCQNNIADQHSFKQELPTSTNCSAMQKSHKCCNTMPVDERHINHLIIKKLKSINDHSSQITEIIKQKVCHQVNECPNCCTKIDCKPFIFTNDITAAKAQGTLHNTFNDDENDIKLACDSTNIIYTRSDRNKCIYVVNHFDEHVMTVHEKRVQRLDQSNDACTVSTTFTEDQIVKPPLSNQYVNFDNIRMNDYDNAAKYSEAAIKEQQQKRIDYDSSMLNDRLHSLESCTFGINSFEIGSNAEINYDLKSFPKIEEADEITKTDYVDNLGHINFLDNIQSETLLEDSFRQFSEPQINYDYLTKKPLMYTDNDTIVKPQDTLHNIFNADETPYDTNVICMLSDHDKRIYLTNHTGEHIMTTSAEKKMQRPNNSNDICTVSTTFTGDQIVEPSLGSQHVSSNNVLMYIENTMEEQERSNCDTSMLNEHSSELCTFDIDSFEVDSKEANEMKTDCANDFEISENISFLHNIQMETLEHILSNDTTNFLL